MATYLDGNVRRATPNTVTSMRRSAKARQCPACGRKSALSRFTEDWGYGAVCRWKAEGKCDYERITPRPYDAEPCTNSAGPDAPAG